MCEIKPDKTLDLEYVPCPMNFVRTKLALEDMSAGEVLEIILDDGDPIKNVPRAVRDEGHEVLKVTKVENKWRVIIRKK